MYREPKQPLGFFEAILSASIIAAVVFLSFYFLADIRQPEMVRLTYLGLDAKNAQQDNAVADSAQLCPGSDLPCLPPEGVLVAERPSD